MPTNHNNNNNNNKKKKKKKSSIMQIFVLRLNPLTNLVIRETR